MTKLNKGAIPRLTQEIFFTRMRAVFQVHRRRTDGQAGGGLES